MRIELKIAIEQREGTQRLYEWSQVTSAAGVICAWHVIVLLSDMITNTCGTKQRLGCSFRPRQVWKRGVITPSSLVQSREQQESRPRCLVA